MTSFGRPFKPAFEGRPLVPGCSDKTSRSVYLAEQERPGSAVVRAASSSRCGACICATYSPKGQHTVFDCSTFLYVRSTCITSNPRQEPVHTFCCSTCSCLVLCLQKLTTASRASAALEQYWQQQGTASISNSSTSNSNNSTASTHSPSTTAERPAGQKVQQQGKHAALPGGERELAHKTRDACKKLEEVQLGMRFIRRACLAAHPCAVHHHHIWFAQILHWQDPSAVSAGQQIPAIIACSTQARQVKGSNSNGTCIVAAGWRDSVQLAHQPGTYIPDCVGTPKDIEEKEKGR